VSDTPDSSIDLSADERALADELESNRPIPGGRFRGGLGRYLAEHDPGYGPRPPHLWLLTSGLLLTGLLLLGLGALQATGAF
jgi:hypothetical protein